jgi:seryl-tRNA synthetase
MPPSETMAGIVSRTFREELLRQGLLVATGVSGVYGRSEEFEDTLTRIDSVVNAAGAGDRPEILRFPPVLNRTHFERSGFIKSFPHLVGTIHSFAGNERAHRSLLQAAEDGTDWSAAFADAGVVLTPAACYPVYPLLAGTLPSTGRLVDVMSYCFRHEPSEDVGRMQMFRMHEHVRAGEPDTIAAWRETWLGRAGTFIDALGLDDVARVEAASDPFFGRTGKLLAESQRAQRLKLEIVAPIASDHCHTAIISLNNHQDHFSALFGIATADGAVAHTSCIGFGLERITLALYRRHGFDRRRWPSRVRQVLDL